MFTPSTLTRREFLVRSAATVATSRFAVSAPSAAEPIIDIHQHLNYGGTRNKIFEQVGLARNDDELVAHQLALGVTKTILLPAGRAVLRPSTHVGFSNGLNGTVSGNAAALALARQYPNEFVFGANEVSDLEDAPQEIERYLKLGACLIGEQKFGVDCDSKAMQQLYQLAKAYSVPVLIHWQIASYNHGFDRFHAMLKKYPKVNFIGHAQTWWANIDRDYQDDAKNLYPKGKVTPGGLTDRYLRDFPNMYADLSAGSGEGAFKRDPEHAGDFFVRHQDKLLFGSDCSDKIGGLTVCSGARQIAQIRQYSTSMAIEQKLLYENAKKLFHF